MVVLIDNYDSFTYNLVQRIGELDADARNPRLSQRPGHARRRSRPSGPTTSSSRPARARRAKAGISNDVIRHFAGRVPMLGVCLGHQCIGYVYGANVIRAPRLMHGKTSHDPARRAGDFSRRAATRSRRRAITR